MLRPSQQDTHLAKRPAPWSKGLLCDWDVLSGKCTMYKNVLLTRTQRAKLIPCRLGRNNYINRTQSVQAFSAISFFIPPTLLYRCKKPCPCICNPLPSNFVDGSYASCIWLKSHYIQLTVDSASGSLYFLYNARYKTAPFSPSVFNL